MPSKQKWLVGPFITSVGSYWTLVAGSWSVWLGNVVCIRTSQSHIAARTRRPRMSASARHHRRLLLVAARLRHAEQIAKERGLAVPVLALQGWRSWRGGIVAHDLTSGQPGEAADIMNEPSAADRVTKRRRLAASPRDARPHRFLRTARRGEEVAPPPHHPPPRAGCEVDHRVTPPGAGGTSLLRAAGLPPMGGRAFSSKSVRHGKHGDVALGAATCLPRGVIPESSGRQMWRGAPSARAAGNGI